MTKDLDQQTKSGPQWPDWLNRTVITGILFAVCGLLVFGSEDPSLGHVANTFGIAVLGTGVVRLLFLLRGLAVSTRRSVATSLLLVAVGIVLISLDPRSVRDLAYVVAIGLGLHGVRLLWRAVKTRRGDDAHEANRGLPAQSASVVVAQASATAQGVEGGFWLAVAAAIAIVPTTVLELLVVIATFALLGTGTILIAYGVSATTRVEARQLDAQSIPLVLRQWFANQDLGPVRRREISTSLFYEEPDAKGKRLSFAIMMALSTVIATFAVIQDSTAVVIGAMLVAPLMTPILGIAAGIVGAWPRRVVASLITVSLGAGGAIAVAFLASSWLPTTVLLTTNSQITSRTSPTLLDMAIAVAAGAAGAYATVDKRVSSSLSGVAIAVALVPPLAVVGITLRTSAYDDAFGAFVLFATNAVSIVLAGAAVLLLCGFSSAERLGRYQDALRTSLVSVVTVGLVIVIPLTFTGDALVSNSVRESKIKSAVDEWLPDGEGWQLLSSNTDGDVVTISVVGPADPPAAIELREGLSESLGSDFSVVVNFIESRQLQSPG